MFLEPTADWARTLTKHLVHLRFLASLVAIFGEYDISGELEKKRSVTKNVKHVVLHGGYNEDTYENDLALLELESPIHYDTHIGMDATMATYCNGVEISFQSLISCVAFISVPICMPPDSSDFTGRMATVTGWGRLKYRGALPSILQEVQVRA